MSQPPPPPPQPSPPPRPPQRPRIPGCAECGGARIGNISLAAPDAGATGLHPFDRTRWFNSALGLLCAYVCLKCGHVKLYANDLAKVREAAEQHPEWFQW